MGRIFVYDDREFPDPGPRDERRAGKGDSWPISTAKSPTPRSRRPARGDDTIIEFQRRVGTKGACTTAGR